MTRRTGQRRYVTEIIADEVETWAAEREDSAGRRRRGTDTGSGFAEVEDDRLPVRRWRAYACDSTRRCVTWRALR